MKYIMSSLLTVPALMLRENPQQRPNIYQVMKEISRMRGTDVPIKDVSKSKVHVEWLLIDLDLCWKISIRSSKKSTPTLI